MSTIAAPVRAGRLFLLVGAAALSVCTASVAAGGYELIPLGFTDAEHTSADGTRRVLLLPEHDPGRMNALGDVIGQQQRYAGSSEIGVSAWIHTGGQTWRLGFTDAAYTGPLGEQFSRPSKISDAGHVVGHSSHYASAGTHAWLYAAGTTVRLGLTDVEHTNRNGGTQIGGSTGVNNLGQAIGYSWRYSSTGAAAGQTAWLYSGGLTQRLGLQGAEFTGAGGYLRSDAAQINDAGQVLGKTDRFSSAGVKNGESPWLYSGGTTQRAGLEGSGYTGLNGEYTSVAYYFNQLGQVAGYTQRYLANGAFGGASVWLHSDGSTLPLGLTGSQYIRAADGYQYSSLYDISNAGHVVGASTSFLSDGQHAWLYVNGATTRIGLTDREHTRPNGYQYSYPSAVNALGQAIGVSQHFAGASGRSAWIHADGQTRRLGLMDAMHTGARGARDSYPLLLNGAGQVVGYSARYDGTKSRGASGWFYDSRDGSTSALVFSTHSDGTANVWMTHLSEQGLVLGWYTLFNGTRNLGTRAFAWSRERGFVDLGAEVDGGLRAAGWSRTMSAYDSAADDQIILGDGVLADGSVGFYVLKETSAPAPSPAAWTMTPVPQREGAFVRASPELDAPMHMGAVSRPVIGITATSLQARQVLALGLKAAPSVGISAVRPGSPAQIAGLQVGDVVLAVDGASVATAAALFDAIAARKVGGSVDLRLHRQGRVIDTQAVTEASNR